MLYLQASCQDSEDFQVFMAALTQVCHEWRTLFLDVPSLWSKIVYTRNVTLLNRHLTSSKTALLSIDARGPVVMGYGCFMKPSPNLLHRFCQKVEAHLSRARELRLELNLDRFTTLAQTFSDNGLPNLEVFELIHDDRDGVLPRGETWNFVSRIAQLFPILRTLALCRYPISIRDLKCPSSLTSLDLVQSGTSQLACTAAEVVLVLRQVQHLRSLRLIRLVSDPVFDIGGHVA